MSKRKWFVLALLTHVFILCMQAQRYDSVEIISNESERQGVANVKKADRSEKGLPSDTLKEYYDNGTLKSVYYPYRKQYKYGGRKYPFSMYAEYDENGQCTQFRDDKLGIERRYRNGALTSELIYSRKKNRIVQFVEYHPDGIRKTLILNQNRYDYDRQERLRRHWIRKSGRYNRKYSVLSATFNFEEYDVDGNISRTGRFYSEMKEMDLFRHLKPEFPAAMDSVPTQDFKEVEYPMLGLKDVYRWDYTNNRTIIFRYRQMGNRWVEVERKSLSRLFPAD